MLSRAKWNALECARKLLFLVISRFAPTRTLVIGMDETIECCWGRKIKARGISEIENLFFDRCLSSDFEKN